MFFKLNHEFVDYVDARKNYAKWYNEEDLQYPNPFILQLQETFKYRTGSITFTYFNYNGFHRNMQHNHIYTIQQDEIVQNKQHEFPKGRYFLCLSVFG